MSKLYFRYGAMNSGKSTILLQTIHNYESNGYKVILLKSSIDTKGDDKIVSRLGIKRKVDYLIDKNFNILGINLDDIKCIFVDEAQFLTENQVFCLFKISKVYNIPVICYGLRTKYNGKLFPGSKRLMELSDEMEEIYTICKCGKKAKFNARYVNNKIVKDGEEVVIDNDSNVLYKPLCGKCFLKEFY